MKIFNVYVSDYHYSSLHIVRCKSTVLINVCADYVIDNFFFQHLLLCGKTFQERERKKKIVKVLDTIQWRMSKSKRFWCF